MIVICPWMLSIETIRCVTNLWGTVDLGMKTQWVCTWEDTKAGISTAYTPVKEDEYSGTSLLFYPLNKGQLSCSKLTVYNTLLCCLTSERTPPHKGKFQGSQRCKAPPYLFVPITFLVNSSTLANDKLMIQLDYEQEVLKLMCTPTSLDPFKYIFLSPFQFPLT